MAQARTYHAALRDPRRMACEPALVASLVRRVLADQGIAVGDDPGRAGLIRGDGFDLSVRFAPLPERGPLRLVLTMTEHAAGAEAVLDPDLVLIIVMYRLTQAMRPASVEWLDDAAVIPTEAFLAAFDGVDSDESAKAVRTRRRMSRPPDAPSRVDPAPKPAATEDQLIARRLRQDSFAIPPTRAEKARNDIQRLTVWAMTGCIASLSLPVAASMVAVNLIRGEDFRLSTQVLSLTGLVGTVSGFGL